MKFVLNGAWIERNNVISGKILSSRGSLIEVPVLKGTCLQWKNPAPCGFLIGRFLSIYDLLRDETDFFFGEEKNEILQRRNDSTQQKGSGITDRNTRDVFLFPTADKQNSRHDNRTATELGDVDGRRVRKQRELGTKLAKYCNEILLNVYRASS